MRKIVRHVTFRPHQMLSEYFTEQVEHRIVQQIAHAAQDINGLMGQHPVQQTAFEYGDQENETADRKGSAVRGVGRPQHTEKDGRSDRIPYV